MTIRNYDRYDSVTEKYNIPNYNRKDEAGKYLPLWKEIKEDAGIEHFKIICKAHNCEILFDTDLTTEQISEVDTIVYNHQYNIGGGD